MPSPQKDFSLQRERDFRLADEDICGESSSRMESSDRGAKRPMDAVNPEFVSNKKQASGDVSPKSSDTDSSDVDDLLKLSLWSGGVRNFKAYGANERSDDNTITNAATGDNADGDRFLFDSDSSAYAPVKSEGNFLLMGHTINIVDRNLTPTDRNTLHDAPATPLDLSLAMPGQQDSRHSTKSTVTNSISSSSSTTGTSSKGEEASPSYKKFYLQNFPCSVKNLLSTGIFDGMRVKYFSWTRELSLEGIIQGTKFLCGCNECNFSKTVCAYEFESHAGTKTNHPNNHIYFESGKTIHKVVGELKKTPREELFDVIRNVSGSQINEANYNIWKREIIK